MTRIAAPLAAGSDTIGCSAPSAVEPGPSERLHASSGSLHAGLVVLGSLLIIAAPLAGIPLDGSRTGAGLCLLLLVVGLPHGALDIERLKGGLASGWQTLAGLLALYLCLAAGMLALWQTAPLAALAVFLAVAVAHFAEDWQALEQPFLSLGVAVALITAATFRNLADVQAIFVAVTGQAGASVLGECLLLAAPIALAVAMLAIVRLALTGHRRLAAITAAILAAMLFAPPLAGFALFFCLYHSPRHLRESWDSLRQPAPPRRLLVLLALTGAALGIAALLALAHNRTGLTDAMLAATFMTFSILTVPHMLAGPLLTRLREARRRFAV